MLRPRRLAFGADMSVGRSASRTFRRPDEGAGRLRSARRTTVGTAALACAGMSPRRLLVAVSAVQFAANLTGQVVALRRRRHFDVPFMTGSPEHVGRDSWWFGTAYSAPSYMLAGQAYAIARLT